MKSRRSERVSKSKGSASASTVVVAISCFCRQAVKVSTEFFARRCRESKSVREENGRNFAHSRETPAAGFCGAELHVKARGPLRGTREGHTPDARRRRARDQQKWESVDERVTQDFGSAPWTSFLVLLPCLLQSSAA